MKFIVTLLTTVAVASAQYTELPGPNNYSGQCAGEYDDNIEWQCDGPVRSGFEYEYERQ